MGAQYNLVIAHSWLYETNASFQHQIKNGEISATFFFEVQKEPYH